ncbi:hypothetical protein F5Y01DRAFT_263019 [Xylaria sp. FL0043]|nr:hypothetical protein F5Y01DRAFT_263019 [Xylaria sp. FL0043]
MARSTRSSKSSKRQARPSHSAGSNASSIKSDTKPSPSSKRQKHNKASMAKDASSLAATYTPGSSTSDPDGAIYFWRPEEAATGYLSQWYGLRPFRDRADTGNVYATAEHYMMYQKAVLFGDPEMGPEILAATSPRDVKALGRQVRGFEPAVWEREREKIVTEGNWCKFSLPVVDEHGGKGEGEGEGKGEEGEVEWQLGHGAGAQTMRARSLRDVLLATGARELVEASPRDRIWGVGFGAKNAVNNRHKWGKNLLGKCLMEVREQFRKEKETEAEAEVRKRERAKDHEVEGSVQSCQ